MELIVDFEIAWKILFFNYGFFGLFVGFDMNFRNLVDIVNDFSDKQF